jgi:hypothetical protein
MRRAKAAHWPAGHLTWSSAQRPQLPPQQCGYHQVKFGGEIRLARGRGLWIGSDHKQATSRQRLQIPERGRTQPPTHPVPYHGAPNGTADDKAHQGRRLTVGPHQQVTSQQPTARATAATDGRGELFPPPHPGLCGKH